MCSLIYLQMTPIRRDNGGQTSNLYLFRTDIKTKKSVKSIRTIFDNHPGIRNWSVDTEDIDNVLRVEALNGFSETDVHKLVQLFGFYCNTLRD